MSQTGRTRARRKTVAKHTATLKPVRRKYWSAEVTQKSYALDLERNVFALRSPGAIARSLKRSADRSRRRKANPFQSAMSMLNFYINRAGRNLPPARKDILNRAKDELRKLYHRAAAPPASTPAPAPWRARRPRP